MTTTETMEMPYLYLLHRTDGIGAKTIRSLMQAFGNARAVCHATEKELSHFLSERQLNEFLEERKKNDPEKVYEALVKNRIRFITAQDGDYPQRLRNIPDPPYALYVRGELPGEDFPTVAVVGARICSEYGRYMARQFGTELAQAGIRVVSGMAMGVDSIAQRACLRAGGRSYAVLGCGADVCYPPENRDLYDQLTENGGVISEYIPGTEPKRNLFPARNRIIAGLADAVLVVEARKKSGTLITVDMALEQGRDVYALPGRATDRLSDGCNHLLRQGAMIATSAADIIEGFFGVREDPVTYAREKSQPAFSLSENERSVLDVLDADPKAVSEIEYLLTQRQTVMPPQELMCLLVNMALKGLIEQEGAFFAKPCASHV